jgi:tetratricopeptide (TPR) repeat protein
VSDERYYPSARVPSSYSALARARRDCPKTSEIVVWPFKVEVITENARAQGPLTFIFKWSGDWRLTRIFLPNPMAVMVSNVGDRHFLKGEYDLAIQKFNEAIRFNPNYVEAYNGRGLVYEKKGELQRALVDYKVAVSLGSREAAENVERVTKLLSMNHKNDVNHASSTQGIKTDPEEAIADSQDKVADTEKIKAEGVLKSREVEEAEKLSRELREERLRRESAEPTQTPR